MNFLLLCSLCPMEEVHSIGMFFVGFVFKLLKGRLCMGSISFRCERTKVTEQIYEYQTEIFTGSFFDAILIIKCTKVYY